MDKDNHIMGSAYAAGESSLTFFGGLKPDTMSLYLTDIAHHHLAVGILFVWAGHVYSSLYKGFACGRMWPMARPHGRPGPLDTNLWTVFYLNY
jgi:hypothetical protein